MEDKNNINYCLSNEDINKYLPDIEIYNYHDLSICNNLIDLLPKRKCALIIIAEQIANFGHWISIVRIGNKIIFFDSFGNRPDKTISFTEKSLRKTLNQDIPHVSYLFNKLIDSGYICSFNNFGYQNKNSCVCGRYAVLFISWFMHTTKPDLLKFYHFIEHNCEKYKLPSDELTVKLVPL